MFPSIVALSLFTASALGCAQHDNYHYPGQQKKRADAGETRDWEYAQSFEWASLNSDYEMCQAGTHQVPIGLRLEDSPAVTHKPSFKYEGNFEGNFYNWGFGPAFTISHEEGNLTSNPSFTYDNTTVYLTGWHIHTPAEHTVAAHRAKAELHLVHADADGNPKAVVGIRMEAGASNSSFVEQLPTPMVHWNETDVEEPLDLNLDLALQEVGHVDEYWTYEGSLTTPPCSEGIRWFMARRNLYTGLDQMVSILKASRFGARPQQQVWQHNINA
ncbi:hypothetical protein Q7P37_011166 [Cladosporium fusiforme]